MKWRKEYNLAIGIVELTVLTVLLSLHSRVHLPIFPYILIASLSVVNFGVWIVKTFKPLGKQGELA